MKQPVLLLDLDDTLYPEESYVRSGYRAVAEHLVRHVLSGIPAEEVFQRLWYEFRRLGRTGVFDRTLKHFGHADRDVVSDLVEVYRNHEPDVKPFPGVPEGLRQLRAFCRMALVTDGAPRMQRRKVAALGALLEGIPVVCCWEHEAPKPELGAFRLAAEKLGASLKECIFIGDDPYHDMLAACRASAPGIRVRTGRAAEVATMHPPAPYAEVRDFAEVPQAVRELMAEEA